MEKRDPFKGIFEVALTLLGIFTASSLFSSAGNEVTVLTAAIYPFLLIIPLWLAKELYKNHYPLLNLLLTEICWGIWSLTFAYYLSAFFIIIVPSFAFFSVIVASVVGSSLFILVSLAYTLEYRKEFETFYRSKWVALRAGLELIFLVVVYLIFMPL